ncbi:MAG: fibronectin type III domain-containing protein [Nitrososphaerota archaeon]|jgi:hypothetical protein|nr:fibronectin type III domain-containing protein [Nitrososphaerota archaeon]
MQMHSTTSAKKIISIVLTLSILFSMMATVLPYATAAELSESEYQISNFGDWYYYYGRTNSELLTDAFDMSALNGWTYAQTMIGFGSGPSGHTLRTTIPSGIDPSQRGSPLHTWVYLKKTFELPEDFNVDDISDVSGIHVIDDALVIFINGIEVYRYNSAPRGININMNDPIDWGVYMGYNTEELERSFDINSDYNDRECGPSGLGDGNIVHDAASLTNLMTALKPGTNVITCALGQRDSASSDIFFDLQMSITINGNTNEPIIVPMAVSYLTLSPGTDATQLNFSWHTATQTNSPVVRIWKQDGVTMEFTGTSSTSTSTLSSMYYNRVTVTGLETNTAYTYQLGDGNDNWSVEYNTKTSTPDSFSYIVFGDPQVSSQTYGNNWKNTLELALSVNPNVAFMASTGDNVDSNTKAQYDYFFTPKEIFSYLPLAICMGNHEGSGTTPHAFYNPPNADSAQNYWYRYGDALFMVWNCVTGNEASMDAFLSSAIEANPDATWKILNFHYDVYGQGSSHALSDGKNYRDRYVQVIDRFDIDIVFNGHDHSYSRSYPMKWSGSSSTSNTQGMQPETFGPNGESINPTGTVYFSLNSASGQKYYNLVAKQEYTAVMQQANRPHFSIVDITTNSFICTTYQVNADNSLTLIDSYTIIKPTTALNAVVALSGVETVVAGSDAAYTVSVGGVSKLATVTLQFEVDGAYFTGKSFTGLNGFDVLGGVEWTLFGDDVWLGRVTLVNLDGGVSNVDVLDIFEMVFSSNSELLGTTDVRLVDVVLSGYDDANTAIYIDSVITPDLVQTTLEQYFSVFDVNRDGVVDQLDLTAAQLFFMTQEGDDTWSAAKFADVNNDGIVDIEDLIIILNNIAW